MFVTPPEQFWQITPCLSQILKSLHGPRCSLGLPGCKGSTLLGGPGPSKSLEGLLALGEGDAPSDGQVPVLAISASVSWF